MAKRGHAHGSSVFCTAGLRRSFRLSRKEKENNGNEGKQAEQADGAEFLTYEEVTKYQQQPGEQQRLVVLIGKIPSLFKIFHISPSSLILHFQRLSLDVWFGGFCSSGGFLKNVFLDFVRTHSFILNYIKRKRKQTIKLIKSF